MSIASRDLLEEYYESDYPLSHVNRNGQSLLNLYLASAISLDFQTCKDLVAHQNFSPLQLTKQRENLLAVLLKRPDATLAIVHLFLSVGVDPVSVNE